MRTPLHLLKKGKIREWNEFRFVDRRALHLEGISFAGLHLPYVDFTGADLTNCDFSGCQLYGTRFGDAVLDSANFRHATLEAATFDKCSAGSVSFYGASVRSCRFSEARLTSTDWNSAFVFASAFTFANLDEASFYSTTMASCGFTHATLRRARFVQTVISRAFFYDTDVTGAEFDTIVLVGVDDLRRVIGLESVAFSGRGYIGIDVLLNSGSVLSREMLQHFRVPGGVMDTLPAAPAELPSFCSCFISYSHLDDPFVRKLYHDLQTNGVKCWLDEVDLRIGDKIRQVIDTEIRAHDKVLLVLSKDSLASKWVEKEVESAFERESKEAQTVLFPIRLDDTVMNTTESWAKDIRRARYIGDFTRWQSPLDYQAAIARLLKDLRLSTVAKSDAG